MLHATSITIGENRGRARLWLQGRRLAAIGAVVGARFDLETDRNRGRIRIIVRTGGLRVVSGKDGDVPVIDAVGREVGATFPVGTRVRVVFSPSEITVTVHPSDAAAAARIARLAGKVAAGLPIDTGAVCFGGGFLDAAVHDGLARTGIVSNLRFAIDMDADALDTAMANNPIWRPDTLSIADQIALVDVAVLPTVDCLIAGLPCTSASRPGRAKQRSLDRALRHPEGNDAGAAFVHLIRILIAVNPAVMLLENVPLYAETAGYACLVATLRALGYNTSDTTVQSSEWGCIEQRERLVLVATTGAALPLDDLAPLVSPPPLEDILDPISESDHRWRTHAHQQAYVERDLAAGKNFRLQLVTPAARRIGVLGRGYSKDRRSEPHLLHPTDPTRSRLLTIREHARAKGIPEAFVAGLGHMRGHQLLGQSVCYPPFVSVGERLGRWMGGMRAANDAQRPVVAPRPADVQQGDGRSSRQLCLFPNGVLAAAC